MLVIAAVGPIRQLIDGVLLVPLYIGNLYQLFADAAEALLPVSPFSLRRTTRLCFVLLSTDSLTDKRTSPWLRQASELMALPVSIVFTPQVAEFLDALPPAVAMPSSAW